MKKARLVLLLLVHSIMPADWITAVKAEIQLIAPDSLAAAASSESTQWGNRFAIYAVNGSGMTGDAHSASGANNQMWMSYSDALPQWFKVDLGSSFDMNSMKVWNFNWTGYTNRGCKNVDIYYSNSGSDPGNPINNPANWNFFGSYILTQAPGANDYGTTNAVIPDVIELSGLTIRWFALKINSSYGGSYCGLGEIRFFKDVVTPEVFAAGDTSKDGRVDFNDLLIVTQNWLASDCNSQNNWCSGADIDQSGSVDMKDFAVLAQNWLKLQSWRPGIDSQTVLVETENFTNTGGWGIDQQFMDQMGSPYLIAHGLGKPVADANTAVQFSAAGQYRVWVRTLDWIAKFGYTGSPGKFNLIVNGQTIAAAFGTQGATWHWQDGGMVEIINPLTGIALHDLTGFEGRCDAILFTTDLQFVPPNKTEELKAFRNWAAKKPVQPDDVGQFDLVT